MVGAGDSEGPPDGLSEWIGVGPGDGSMEGVEDGLIDGAELIDGVAEGWSVYPHALSTDTSNQNSVALASTVA